MLKEVHLYLKGHFGNGQVASHNKGIIIRVLPRHWAVIGGLGTDMSIFILQPCFYTQNTQFSKFFPTVVVGGMSECWARPPSAAHRGQNPA